MIQRLKASYLGVLDALTAWIEAEEDLITLDDQQKGWTDKELDGLRKAVKK